MFLQSMSLTVQHFYKTPTKDKNQPDFMVISEMHEFHQVAWTELQNTPKVRFYGNEYAA